MKNSAHTDDKDPTPSMDNDVYDHPNAKLTQLSLKVMALRCAYRENEATAYYLIGLVTVRSRARHAP